MKKIFLGISILFVLSTVTGCDAIYRMLQKEGAQEMDHLGEVVPGIANVQVERVQALLKLYGYTIGNVDGVLGNNTRNAIEAFQQDNGIAPTRFMCDQTWIALHQFEDSGLVQNDRINDKVVQEALTNAGFNPGKVDGRMGPRSMAALKDFQYANGLKPDGRIGFKTLTKLRSHLGVKK